LITPPPQAICSQKQNFPEVQSDQVLEELTASRDRPVKECKPIQE